MEQGGWRLLVKRTLDVTVAGAVLVATAPILAASAAVVRLRMGSPVLFRQARTGRDGKTFSLYKLRTMRDARDASGKPLLDAERLTTLGRWLRQTSVDELPQLWNVLRGDMSLVGPRPLLPKYLERYTSEQARRHDVLPGITGWTQVNGRSTLSWDERFRHDIYYVDHWSLWLDARILFRTLPKVIGRQGTQTSPEFMGTGAPERREP